MCESSGSRYLLRRVACLAVFLAILADGPAGGQVGDVCSLPKPSIPWPDGCTVPHSPGLVQLGLNGIFLDACNNHDRCYAQCNLEFGPYLGLGHKIACDTTLGAEMSEACAFWAGGIAFPAGGFQTAEEFLAVCGAFPAIFVAAVTVFGQDAYDKDQCIRGCNADKCDGLGGCAIPNPQNGLDVPPTCGRGPFGPGYCYLSVASFCPPDFACGTGSYGCYWDSVNCDCECSPILIDVEGHGFHLTSVEKGVLFDLRGNGVKKLMAWTAPGSGDAFLALDRNGNGVIDDGTELFGNFTEQPDSDHRNGFLALAEFDKPENGGNGDGVIDRRDKIFGSLLLWIDENHNGIAESNELHSLASMDIEAIDLRYQEARRRDAFGNAFKYRARVRSSKEGDVGHWAYDIFLLIHP